MANIQAVSRVEHANKRWKRAQGYQFAQQDSFCPLVIHELPKAMLTMPIGFIVGGEGYLPVAVLGLGQRKNLFVHPNGSWLGGYVPAAYRSFPFMLVKQSDDQQVLCFDGDSDLVSDGPDGEPFFDEEGKITETISDVLAYLTKIDSNRKVTAAMCALLQSHDLIQPWSFTLQFSEGEEQVIQGLYRIDEARFMQLSAETLHELRSKGAFPTIYCQLLSMQHTSQLTALAGAHSQLAATPVPEELDLDFLNDNSNLSFGD